MQIALRKICPSCGHGNSGAENLCQNCGKELHPDHYKIFREGANFGVALKGRVIFQGLTLTKAQQVAMILNGDMEVAEVGVA